MPITDFFNSCKWFEKVFHISCSGICHKELILPSAAEVKNFRRVVSVEKTFCVLECDGVSQRRQLFPKSSTLSL